MDSFGNAICEQCEEENFFMDGTKCARCLGLGFLPIDDEDDGEESTSIFSDRLAAA
jgi:hypothetical protein